VVVFSPPHHTVLENGICKQEQHPCDARLKVQHKPITAFGFFFYPQMVHTPTNQKC